MNYLANTLFIIYIWLFIGLCFFLRIIIQLVKLFQFKKEKQPTTSVLILASFFPGNAGYNYRSLKWAEILRSEKVSVDVFHIMNAEKQSELLSRKSHVSFLFQSIFIRFIQILKSVKYDKVIVRRTSVRYNDYGRLFLDKLLLSIHPKAILDFDDDLSNNLNDNSKTSLFGKLLLEDRLIFYRALKLYRKFIPGSDYLKILLTHQNKNIGEKDALVVPTNVDYEKYAGKKYYNDKVPITFGWIGSNFNQYLINNVIPVLNNVSKKIDLELLVISGDKFESDRADFPIRNISWSLESEIESLCQIDVGLMPLDNDKMSRAKCGFKLLQYMGIGIVSIASAVTTNNRIIDDGINGFLVQNEEEWEEVMLKVISKRSEFETISINARNKVKEDYSFQSHADNLRSFLEISSK